MSRYNRCILCEHHSDFIGSNNYYLCHHPKINERINKTQDTSKCGFYLHSGDICQALIRGHKKAIEEAGKAGILPGSSIEKLLPPQNERK